MKSIVSNSEWNLKRHIESIHQKSRKHVVSFFFVSLGVGECLVNEVSVNKYVLGFAGSNTILSIKVLIVIKIKIN